MKKLNNYIILDLDDIYERIEQLREELNMSEQNPDSLSASIIFYQIKELIMLKELGIPSVKLAELAYEAGKLDKELSIMFDNPKGRFLNEEINLK